jgi:hypothetical protein
MNPIIEAIVGTSILFVFGITFAQSGVKSLSDAGGWMIGAGIMIVGAICLALYIMITRH